MGRNLVPISARSKRDLKARLTVNRLGYYPTHPYMPGLVKIDLTERLTDARAHDLFTTGSLGRSESARPALMLQDQCIGVAFTVRLFGGWHWFPILFCETEITPTQ